MGLNPLWTTATRPGRGSLMAGGSPLNTRHSEGASDEAENVELEAVEVKGKVKTKKFETN